MKVEVTSNMPETKCNNRRNLIAFFLFGLTNNFAYVIMLSAATDILKPTAHNETAQNRTGMLIPHCNPIGTGAVLLADIIPAFVIKLSLPLVLHKMPFGLRVFGTVLLAAASFPIVSQSPWLWLSLLGVVLASASSGLGELTFLSLSAHFDKNSVSTWSSGTGAAGVSGAASYAGFRAAGVNPRITLLIMLVVPLAMLCTYNPLLVRPNSVKSYKRRNETDEDEPLLGSAAINAEARPTWRTNIRLLPNLLRYIIPLTVVYFCEYFINQALFELITFASWIPINEQYRWYQLLYQIGVFISRSSVNLIHIRKLWIFAVLQIVVLAATFVQVFVNYLQSVWVMFLVILIEGLIGGAAYVNTFYRLYQDIPPIDQEFSLSAVCISDTLGIMVAGAVAVPVHNFICALPA